MLISMMTLPKPPPIAPRINDQGLVEYVDIFTGQVLAIQSTPNDDFLHNRFENLVEIDTPHGRVFIERHLDPGRILRSGVSRHIFSLAWAELIAQKLLEPRHRLNAHDPTNHTPYTLKEAVATLEIPYATFTKWRAREEFGAIIDNALQHQAQLLQDEALIQARNTTKSSEVSLSQLKIDTLMKQAKQANQQRFGDKQKVEHSGSVAHTYIISTGVNKNAVAIPEGFEDAIRDATPLRAAREDQPKDSEDISLEEEEKTKARLPPNPWREAADIPQGELLQSKENSPLSIFDIPDQGEDPFAIPIPDIDDSGF